MCCAYFHHYLSLACHTLYAKSTLGQIQNALNQYACVFVLSFFEINLICFIIYDIIVNFAPVILDQQ